MKRFLKITLWIIAAVFVVLTVVMFVLGKQYHYETSIVIKAPVEKVYQASSSSKRFNEWNPWMDMDPNLKLTYSGNQGQVGDQYCWEGNDEVGKGCHSITGLEPNKKVMTKMIFKEPFDSDATSDLVFTPEANGTKVTWSMDCELDYPMNLMKLMMDSQMDKSYGKGLAKLKEISEK